MTTELFDDHCKAKEYLIVQGFDYMKEKWLPLTEGLEHGWISEYPHKHDTEKIARMCDCMNVCFKAKDNDTIPRLIGKIIVSIGTKDEIKN